MHNWILHDREIIEEYVVSALFFFECRYLPELVFFISSGDTFGWPMFFGALFSKISKIFFVILKWVSFQLPELVFLYLLVTRLDDLCDLGGLSFSGLRCAGMSSIEGLSTGPRRLSGNGDRFWLRRSEMSSGLTSDDMEAGGIEGGPGDCFLT